MESLNSMSNQKMRIDLFSDACWFVYFVLLLFHGGQMFMHKVHGDTISNRLNRARVLSMYRKLYTLISVCKFFLLNFTINMHFAGQ